MVKLRKDYEKLEKFRLNFSRWANRDEALLK